ncbi:hypothetical protein M422DRAFT_241802 [Sphaerobolus stellatus SS14]|nr:hypothetical protein M422DRAFT_241802 [Sphaerobolus stellatus SS14]
MLTNSSTFGVVYMLELGVAANITDRPLLHENDIDTFVTTTDAENTESEDELSDSSKEDEGEEDEDEDEE